MSKSMPEPADEDCREEGAGWKLLEHLQEQLGGKQVVDVQLQFWRRHLFPSARLELLHSASPHILNIDPTTNLHSQSEPQLEYGLVVWCFNCALAGRRKNKESSAAALLS